MSEHHVPKHRHDIFFTQALRTITNAITSTGKWPTEDEIEQLAEQLRLQSRTAQDGRLIMENATFLTRSVVYVEVKVAEGQGPEAIQALIRFMTENEIFPATNSLNVDPCRYLIGYFDYDGATLIKRWLFEHGAPNHNNEIIILS